MQPMQMQQMQMPMQMQQMQQMPQQMAGMQMGQMAMAPMTMQGMQMMPMQGMQMMPMGQSMGMQMMPMQGMQMMGMNPMMMMPGQMGGQMQPMGGCGGYSSSSMAMPDVAAPVAPVAPISQLQVARQDVAAANLAALLPQKASSASAPSRSRRRDASDSDEEGRGMQALRNVGRSVALSKEARKTGSSPGAAASAKAVAEADKPSAPDPPARKRCHLHMKHNEKCKLCRRIKDENAALDAGGQSSKSSSKDAADNHESSNRDREKDEAKFQPIFRSSPMLKDQVLKSSYFKSLLDITTVEGLIEEIAEYADTIDVYNSGSVTTPSCFICQVYRLFTFPHSEDELPVMLFSESAIARCVGFVYVRFVFEPTQFWAMLEEHLFDDMELKYQDKDGKTATMSIGEYVEALLTKEKYFGSPLPRVPVKVRQQLDERLAPLPSYRKRMQANRQVFNRGSKDMPVEVCVDSGEWLPGKVTELFGRSTTFVKVRVKLEDGREITSHLGKVVLRDSDSEAASEGSGGGRSDSEGAARKRKRKKQRRSRSRKRGNEQDWSRFKGKSHVEMLEELRERAKEDAVCGHGKVYPRRPLTFEGFATKYESDGRPTPVDGEKRPSFVQPRAAVQNQEDVGEDDITRRLKRKQEDERQRQQQAIFEKYGKQARPESSSAYGDVDKPDVLRLG